MEEEEQKEEEEEEAITSPPSPSLFFEQKFSQPSFVSWMDAADAT